MPAVKPPSTFKVKVTVSDYKTKPPKISQVDMFDLPWVHGDDNRSAAAKAAVQKKFPRGTVSTAHSTNYVILAYVSINTT
jgi:hypothetical protein